MKINKLSIYHKHWLLELDKTGERIPETITIQVNGIDREFIEKI